MDEYFERIEGFLRGDLDEVKRLDLEREASVNNKIKEEIEAHRIAHQVVTDYNLINLRSQLADWHTQNDSGSGYNKTLIGLSVAAILFVGWMSFELIPFDKTEDDFSKSTPLPELMEKKAEVIKEKEIVKRHKIINQISTSDLQDGEVMETETKVESQPLWYSVARKSPFLETEIPTISGLHVPEKPEPDCEKTIPADMLTFQGSCAGKLEGYIHFSDIMIEDFGLTAFSVDSGQTFTQNGMFELLPNGVYHPMVFSNTGCIYASSAPIILFGGKGCDMGNLTVIDVANNQFWEPEFDDEIEALEIRNSSGNLVFSSGISSGFRWDGKKTGGEHLPMGSYYYEAKSKNGVVSSGQVTILY